MLSAKRMIEERLTTVSPADSLQAADFCMKTFSYRHLPVVDGEELVGIISSQDVLRGLAMQEISKKQKFVREFMTSPVITIDRFSSWHEVVDLMLQHKVGALIITDKGQLSSILTDIDIMKVLKNLLQNSDKTVQGALEWSGLSERDLLKSLAALQFR